MREERKMFKVFLKERDHSEDQGLDGIRMDLDFVGGSGFSWYRIWTGDRLL
jgi:hypothetical protein